VFTNEIMAQNQEFMVNPEITNNAELLASWKPKKGFFGKPKPAPPVISSLFIIRTEQTVDALDGEVKIGEVTLAPNTAILSFIVDGFVEAFVLLNSVIHIAQSRKKKEGWGVIVEMTILRGRPIVVEEGIDNQMIEHIIKRLESVATTHVEIARN
jgi:hypothetical protein